ncbi:MAG: hypothetical protein AAF725_03090 [Acidobacteriota bacterium]
MKRLLFLCLAPLLTASMLALSGASLAEEEAETETRPLRSTQAPQQTEAEAANATDAKEQIERGRYLVVNAVVCGGCHTQRTAEGDLVKRQTLHGAPVPVSKPEAWSDPFAYWAPRIAGLPQHTDEEFVRLMTTGVNRDGRYLMLPMPQFRMSEEDAMAIAAYLRSLP